MSAKFFKGSLSKKGHEQVTLIKAKNIKEAACVLGMTEYKFRQCFDSIQPSDLLSLCSNGWAELPSLNEIEVGVIYSKPLFEINRNLNIFRERHIEEIGKLAHLENALVQLKNCHSLQGGNGKRLRRITAELHEIVGDYREELRDKYVGVKLK